MKRARGGIEDLSLCGGGGELDGVDEVGGGGEEGAAALGVAAPAVNGGSSCSCKNVTRTRAHQIKVHCLCCSKP